MSIRWLLALGALVVIAGALLLIRATRDGDSAPRTTTTSSEHTGPAVDARAAVSSTQRPRPALPDDLGAIAESGSNPDISTTGTTPDDEEMPLQDRAAAMSRLGSAREAYKAEDYMRALAIAESVLKVMPTRESAREIAAMSACRVGQQERAQSHADYLELHRFKRTRNVCLDDDIRLVNPYADASLDAGQ